MTRVAVALVHYPCVDKHGEIYATSITNLDVHDIARSARTYGVDAFYIVHPIEAQQKLARAICGFWSEDKHAQKNPDRNEALSRARVVASLEDAYAQEEAETGGPLRRVATSARAEGATVSFDAVRTDIASGRNSFVFFGTGHGLSTQCLEWADDILEPIRGTDTYNHLSVRSAAAIVMDRLLSP